MEELKVVGKSVTRIDEKEKVTGAARYVDDLEFGPALLYAHIVESPYAHAIIKNIDTKEALKVKGVRAVITGKDVPYKFGLYLKDRYVFAIDRVRFIGEQVAAVIGDTPEIAEKASTLVKVEYEVLKPVFDPIEAIKEDAPLIHPDLGTYEVVPWLYPQKGKNISHWRKVRKGDTEKGFKEADLIFEDTYRVPRYAHGPLETHIAVALYSESERLTMWSASQSPHTQRNIIANALHLSHKNVRVVTPYVGGGFGGKAGVTMEVIAAVCAMKVKGRPVKVRWSRAQEFYNTYQRLRVVSKIKMGVKKDGTITALELSNHWDAGPYTEYASNVVNASGLSATGPYRVPNVKIDSYAIYTNLSPTGPYRGFGYSEMLWSIESHINRIAKKLGIDPVEFRKKNAIQEGDILAYGAHMGPTGIIEAIDKVAKAIEYGKEEKSSDPNKVICKGLAAVWKAPAMPINAGSSALLKFSEDGSINILVSGMEIGQGFLTVMAQIASEVLSTPVEKIRVELPDTDRNAYEWQTVASHVTWGCGNAVRRAAIDAREQIFDIMRRVFHYEKEDLYLEDEKVKCKTDPKFSLPLPGFVIYGVQAEDGTFKGGPILGKGSFIPEFTKNGDPETAQGGHPNVHYTTGAGGVVLEVDKQTGKMRVLKAAEAFDCGKAINPDLVYGQMTGGFLQGLATVLFEEIKYDENGKLLNPNFTDYKIPTSMDTPLEFIPIIIEVAQPDGPYGARGVGEHTMIPVAPAIANAIEDGLGIRIKSMPVTAEKLAMAIKEGKKEIE